MLGQFQEERENSKRQKPELRPGAPGVNVASPTAAQEDTSDM